MKKVLPILFALIHCVAFAKDQTTEKIPTISEKTQAMQKWPGYFPLYWDEKNGRLYLEIDKWDQECLYVNSLPAGIGSNDIGLDRGQLGETRIVKFQKTGPKILLIQPNYGYRALTNDSNERRAVEESFAQSVLWGFIAVAEENGKVLVDATDFYLRDARNVSVILKQTKQGNYRLDASRSALYLPRTKNFPQNTEVESTLTFLGEDPGEFIISVVPTPDILTVRQHHSFIQLPDEGYKPRIWDPRSGFNVTSFMDYASPIGEPVRKRWVERHRLVKKDPAAAISEPVRPIIYYVDRGTPEPIRSALMEGAQWWNAAFEAAGFKNAFQVKLMPEGADPMDIRYNLIQWVHRSTRGWSYGYGVTDPRTGEIIKGHVSLGSLRVRQDYLIAEGLLAPYEKGKAVPSTMKEMALARLRQLSAHEVGHTLGLAHNYIASTRNRASVMDYPHPVVQIKEDGTLDLSDAYATGVGEWDKVAITFGYSQFPEGADEKAALEKILQNGISKGIIFISDEAARPPGSAHPEAHLWDNGKNAVDELKHVMQVRSKALSRFSEQNIQVGAPLATIEDVLVPIYLYHRYQTQAAAKVLGGLSYAYAVREDGQMITEIVRPEEQRRALQALLATIDPEALALPENLLRIIPPRPDAYQNSRELFQGHTGLTFDSIAPAETSSDLTIGMILHPQRAARLVEHHAHDKSLPGLTEVISKLIAATWKAPDRNGYLSEIKHAVDSVVLFHLMRLSADPEAQQQARAIASFQLEKLRSWLKAQLPGRTNEDEKSHFYFALQQIENFQKDPGKINVTRPLEQPAGAPIGADQDDLMDCSSM